MASPPSMLSLNPSFTMSMCAQSSATPLPVHPLRHSRPLYDCHPLPPTSPPPHSPEPELVDSDLDPATDPPTACLVLASPLFPWKLEIRPHAADKCVSLAAVREAVNNFLLQPVSEIELERYSAQDESQPSTNSCCSMRERITSAFEKRCADSRRDFGRGAETIVRSVGIQRTDFLGARGIAVDDELRDLRIISVDGEWELCFDGA
ncbi:unnamed protein product [Mycena citricolor]|uniref:DUF6699 domain-containing protein n=1 Tax=Mycena citricolor TaxID=2018698 RepID=A0AAD2HAN2_9AGAR|nr:unnamed protein product [Mycena citricolor]